MRILYYNWVQFDDQEKRGGGVSTYLFNLIDHLVKQDIEIYFLSSGLSYNIFRKGTYIRKTKNVFGIKCNTFEIVNSRVMSPGHFSFHDNRNVFENPEMTEKFEYFLKTKGPFDVIHFHNLEGIPLSFLQSCKNYSPAKIYVTLHNYFPFCPQVNLWWQESSNCVDFRGGSKCVNCLTYDPPYSPALSAHQLAFVLKSIGFGANTKLFRYTFMHINKLKLAYRWFYSVSHYRERQSVSNGDDNKFFIINTNSAGNYLERRVKYVSALNNYCDKIITVSDRTSKVAQSYNVQAAKLSVLYIGTKAAEHFISKRKPPPKGAYITFLFMGYMRTDKGFYFLLDALERLETSLSSKMRLVIAASVIDYSSIKRLRTIAHNFNEIIVYNGYTHDELPKILNGVDVGIVPVMWEDPLPQVAIEMMANGIPLITSDLGGCSELTQTRDFVFNGGSTNDFIKIIGAIFKNPQILDSYWDNTLKLKTIKMHADELLNLYNSDSSAAANP